MKQYFPRIIDQLLEEELESIGAVLLEGPKWCGKTSTAEQLAGSVLYLGNPEVRGPSIILSETEPRRLLEGDTPRLVDEWQILAEKLWDTVRFEVDHRGEFGQFILTGSSTPKKMEQHIHSGTGRIKRIAMRTMSLKESKDSDGSVSLKDLFSGKSISPGESNASLEEIAYLICRGGWPTAVTAEKESVALRQANNYFNAIIYQEDIDSEAFSKTNPEWVAAILRSYARNIGTAAGVPLLYQDSLAHGGASFSENTLVNYITYLKRLFLFEDMEAWHPNLRSKTAIRTSPVRYYTDPSVAAAAMNIGPGALMNDLKTFGFFFENMAARDLRIYAESLNGKVYHFRDKSGLECDAVIVLPDGRYGLVEVKLGGETLIEGGAKNLMALEKKLDTETMHAPSFKMVLCAVAPFSYLRPDGVYVVPISNLGN